MSAPARLQVSLDPCDATPPYRQIRHQIADQITTHILVAGVRLPTVRELANELDLAVNTVARAYKELESAGLVETRGRNGTVVTAAGDSARARLRRAAGTYASAARSSGLSTREALEIVGAALG